MGRSSSCYVYSFFAREDLIKQVNRIQKQWKENPRFIAGSADQIPPDADLDYLRLASELFNRGRRIDS